MDTFTFIVIIMLSYHPMYEDVNISTHDGFMTMSECESYGEEYMSEKPEYDPVSGELPKGYSCVEVEVL